MQFNKLHAKINKKYRDRLYFMTSFYTENFEQFSGKIRLESKMYLKIFTNVTGMLNIAAM